MRHGSCSVWSCANARRRWRWRVASAAAVLACGNAAELFVRSEEAVLSSSASQFSAVSASSLSASTALVCYTDRRQAIEGDPSSALVAGRWCGVIVENETRLEIRTPVALNVSTASADDAATDVVTAAFVGGPPAALACSFFVHPSYSVVCSGLDFVGEPMSYVDKDGDGKLSRTEAMRIRTDLCRHMRLSSGAACSDSQFDEAFKTLDRDGSGFLEADEIEALLNALLSQVGALRSGPSLVVRATGRSDLETQSLWPSATALGPISALLCYADLDANLQGICSAVTRDGLTLRKVDDLVFNTGPTRYISVSGLDGSRAVLCYQDYLKTNKAVCSVVALSGNNLVKGADVVFDNGHVYGISVAALDIFSALACVSTASQTLSCRLLTWNGVSLELQQAADVATGQMRHVSIAALTGNRSLACYTSRGAQDLGKCIDIDMFDNSSCAARGQELQVRSQSFHLRAAALGSSSSLVCYRRGSPLGTDHSIACKLVAPPTKTPQPETGSPPEIGSPGFVAANGSNASRGNASSATVSDGKASGGKASVGNTSAGNGAVVGNSSGNGAVVDREGSGSVANATAGNADAAAGNASVGENGSERGGGFLEEAERSEAPKANEGGLSTGAVVGIVIASLAGCCCLSLILYFCCGCHPDEGRAMIWEEGFKYGRSRM